MSETGTGEKILSIDIGGTLIKAAILNQQGELQSVYHKTDTPKPATPQLLVSAIEELVEKFEDYQKVSVGFPGYVKDGTIYTCPQLGTPIFAGFNLSGQLESVLKKPVRMINDADMQGLGVCSGKGLELVITLGSGLGSALLYNGKLLPHLELSQHPITKKNIHDSYIGAKTLTAIGLNKWNKRVKKILTVFKAVFNYDHLYIGGGNADKINFILEENITVVTNRDGIKGGAKLWE
jgi:polyphosphate glucokinase